MGIAPRFLRVARWAIALYAATFVAVVVQTARFENAPYGTLPPVDTIVCLGAGMDPDGTLHRAAVKRVETCVELFRAGAARSVHFTGGRAAPVGPSAGAQMAALAQELGLPRSVISIEEDSHSTLQNALFSQPMLADARSIRIVTEAFHLPRAYASFALMGAHDIHITMSEPVRQRPDGGWNWSVLAREALAIWFNALRYLVWLASGVVALEGRDAILA